mmetsp:Transcript_21377/g.62348  ORF Transcript_21377/g.62348 Transcript_21377/m.62348 type:complete len:118 (+) Transcript_21377:3723-4076(+)
MRRRGPTSVGAGSCLPKSAAGNLSKECERALAEHLHQLPADVRQQAAAYVDVYIDDFIALIQGTRQERQKETRHIFHTVDRLFRQNDYDHTIRQEPNSIKNLRRGDAYWSTQKKVLG